MSILFLDQGPANLQNLQPIGYLENDLLWRANSIVACPDEGYLQCFKPEIHAA